ncbi:hypothetical protein ARALYDRAFT_891879 [Arabidopsis lyrata subsp. lyrata]|uniref:TLC domain-containing protein n=1 Tax=Arabidopsis lyrata subsp. lyrata TaxID=81972 RepID=D7KF07_ARALL|nr:hypothetical protein ARALYDRAFT_891879 [Arabidopsis lyrata subsp. lyrata]
MESVSVILKLRLRLGISKPLSTLPWDSSSFRGYSSIYSSFLLAFWLLSTGSSPLKSNDATRVKIMKCKESLWKLLYYAGCEFFVLEFVDPEPWFGDIKLYFDGWPNQELKSSLEFFYMCQCGFYVYSVAALLEWETRRKDFAVMMSHHIVTIILISSSYLVEPFLGFLRP